MERGQIRPVKAVLVPNPLLKVEPASPCKGPTSEHFHKAKIPTQAMEGHSQRGQGSKHILPSPSSRGGRGLKIVSILVVNDSIKHTRVMRPQKQTTNPLWTSKAWLIPLVSNISHIVKSSWGLGQWKEGERLRSWNPPRPPLKQPSLWLIFLVSFRYSQPVLIHTAPF